MSRIVTARAFGRRPSGLDARDFPITRMLPRALSTRTTRFWNDQGFWGDQGTTSQCVAYALVHWLEDGPIGQGGRTPPPILQPEVLYHEAQRLDEWPGEDYDGTSVRGGAKALKARGFLGGYYWARTVGEIQEAVLEKGPIVMGTDWYEGMGTEWYDGMDPAPDGVLRLTGAMVGGHAWVINGFNRTLGRFRVKNSWGRGWGLNGRAWIAKSDLATLLAANGEAMLAVEAVPPKEATP